MSKMLRRLAMCSALLLVVSCQGKQATLSDDFSNSIDDYLLRRIGATSQGGRAFCSYETIAKDRQIANRIDVYLWVLCQEYYLNKGSLEFGTGSSLPVALTLMQQDTTWIVIDDRIPGEIALSSQLVYQYFPRSAWTKIMPTSDVEVAEHNARIERLESDNHTKAIAFFAPGSE